MAIGGRMSRRWRVLLIGGLFGAMVVAVAQAQPYPSRPIRLVIPFSPGGATDVPGRLITQKLAERFGQQIIVDNRPGAGSAIGSEIVARAQPDGYTLLLTGTPFAVIPALYPKLAFDPAKDFAPVMQVALAPNVLVVHPSLPVRSVKELIALAQAQPGRINYASGGTGGAQHLFASLFMTMAKINLTHIPYKGSGPATADLLGGHVKVGLPGISIAIPHAKAGRMVPLAVTSARRAPQIPEVPTIDESGVAGYDAAVWFGIFAPKGTPAAIIDGLHDAIVQAVRMPDVENGYLASGNVAITSRPDEFGAFIRNELVKWGRVVREAGIQGE
ncbi:MAG: tripartite tricarboxylate transporter substrate binding protein [Betaproteobacteria bacterium]|nr:tripartite tricarboxylate transporter substrate binding protein [Betaproteobacteria bacterium]